MSSGETAHDDAIEATERYWRDRIGGEIAALVGPESEEKTEEDEAHNDAYFRASQVARGDEFAEPTDCRSEASVTTGLVDAVIGICRVLAKRDLTPAREALADLATDEDVAAVVGPALRRHIADEIEALQTNFLPDGHDEEELIRNDAFRTAASEVRHG